MKGQGEDGPHNLMEMAPALSLASLATPELPTGVGVHGTALPFTLGAVGGSPLPLTGQLTLAYLYCPGDSKAV